jgi:hypothetical protein
MKGRTTPEIGFIKPVMSFFLISLPAGFPNKIVSDGNKYLFDIQGMSIRFFGEWCVY